MTLDESRRVWRDKNRTWLRQYARLSRSKGRVIYRCKQCQITFKGGVVARMHGRLLDHELAIE